MQNADRHKPPFRTPPQPQPDKTVESPKPDMPEPPPPRTLGQGLSCRAGYLRQPRHELSHPTYRIRFRRGWFGRLIIQVEWVVKVYENRMPSAKVKSEHCEWHDATGSVRAEIARGYFTPQSHQVGAKK